MREIAIKPKPKVAVSGSGTLGHWLGSAADMHIAARREAELRGLLSKDFHNLPFLKHNQLSLHVELLLEEILASDRAEKCPVL